MSFWKKLLGELVDIIEWTDNSADTMVWRFDRYQNEIKNGAQLTVRQGQVAIFVNEGKIADIFQAGMYQLTTENLPILSTLKGWKYGFNSPFKAEVYFFNTRVFLNNKWGTKNPVVLRDPEFGPVRLRAFGNYDFQISDPMRLLNQIVGTDGHFQIEQIQQQLRSLLISRFSDSIAESQVPVLDMASNYDEFSALMQKEINIDFNNYGLTLTSFLIENISLPSNVEEILDKRTSINIVGGLDSYMQFQTATAIEQTASNDSVNSGLELGAGMVMAQQMMQSFNSHTEHNHAQPSATPPPIPTQPNIYYIAIGGQQTGPFSLDIMQKKIISCELKKEDHVWKQGLVDWCTANEIEELKQIFLSTPPPIKG